MNSVSFNPSTFVPSRLYHYTTAEGLVGIISSGVLRATNFAFMNDPDEYGYGLRLRSEVLDAIERDARSPVEKKVLASLRTAQEVVRDKLDLFLICLSAAHDRLSQWRAYGSAGRYALVLNPEIIQESKTLTLMQVIYDSEKQRESLVKPIQLGLEALAEIEASGPSSNELDEAAKEIARLLSSRSFFRAPALKNPAFYEEEEWRIVMYNKDPSFIEFTTRAGMIRPHLEVSLSEDTQNLPLEQVLLGPGTDPVLSPKAVSLLLRKHGYADVEVVSASFGLRD